MNFFEEQARARSQSRWLVAAFLASVLAVAGLIGVLIGALLAVGERSGQEPEVLLPPFSQTLLGHSQLMAITAAVVLVVIAVASLYKVVRLKSGGAVVARQLGGTEVRAGSRDARHRRLLNVMEEIAIASGVPVPQVFVLEQQRGINAFAAGYSPSDAVIAVTAGALERLNRDELQGVIGHEFSHILNGDMRLNLRLMGMAFGLLVVYVVGREILANSPRAEKGALAVGAAALGVMLLGALGMLFAALIKARISRSREYLADASAVQFTRQTAGIAGALKKIAGLEAGSKLEGVSGEEVSHMLFGAGQWSLFATHPPVEARLRKLDPAFSPAELRLLTERWRREPPMAEREPAPARPAAAVIGFAAAAGAALAPAPVIAQVARPGEDDYRRAAQLSAGLPEGLRDAAENPETCAPLLLALLLSDSAGGLTQEAHSAIVGTLGDAVVAEVASFTLPVHGLDRSLRLPLASLAFAGLRSRSELELRSLQALITRLTLVDDRIGAFEFALGHLLRVQLDDWFAPAATRSSGRLKLDACSGEVAQLLRLLAEAGTADASAARRAFDCGWQQLYGNARTAPPPDAPNAALDAALSRLDGLLPFAKQALIEAMVSVLAHDGRTTVGEAELLRVVCASLHCPLPPALLGKA